MAALRLGDAAPGFDLPDVDGRRHALSDYNGKPFAVVFSCGERSDGAVVESIRRWRSASGSRCLSAYQTYTVAMTDYLYTNGTDDGFDLSAGLKYMTFQVAQDDSGFVIENWTDDRLQ